MDLFRIYALMKILQTGCLDDTLNNMALDTLRDKAKIYLNGARKRGKFDHAEEIESLVNKYNPYDRSTSLWTTA